MSKKKWEKMSKSRGNVIVPDEVVYGIYHLDKGLEFRLCDGRIIDHLEWGVWRADEGKGFFFTSTRFGKIPAFLHEAGNPLPAKFFIDGKETIQHPNLDEYWNTHVLTRNDEIIQTENGSHVAVYKDDLPSPMVVEKRNENGELEAEECSPICIIEQNDGRAV